MKLYQKAIVYLIALSCIGTGIAFHYFKKKYITAHKEALTDKLDSKIVEINNHLTEIAIATTDINQLPATIDLCLQKPIDLTTYLQTIQPIMKNKEYITLSLFNTNASLIFSTEKQPFSQEKEHIAAAARTARITLKPQIYELYYDKAHRCPVFLIVAPIIFNGTFIGVLAVEKKDQIFNTIIGQIKDNYVTTEEIVLGQIINNTLTVINSNIDSAEPFNTTIPLHSLKASPLAEAAEGNSGVDVIHDYRHIKHVAAWSYIPRLNCGIIIKTVYTTVLAPLVWLRTLWIVLLCITLLLMLLILLPYFFKSINIKWHIALLGLISFIVCLLCIYQGVSLYSSAKKETINDMALRNKIIKQNLNELLYSAQLTGNALAHALTTGTITKENINKQILQTLNESPNIIQITISYTPYSYDQKTRLYAPSAIHKNGAVAIRDLALDYDYTAADTATEKTDWYHVPLESQKMSWVKTHYVASSKTLGCTFSVPFYSDDSYTKINGIVAIVISYEALKGLIDAINFNQLGYTMIIDQADTFVYHPDTNYITQDNTFESLQIFPLNNAGQKLYRHIKETAQGIMSYVNIHNGNSWIFLNSLAFPEWKILSVLDKNSIKIPYKQIYHDILYSIICLIITLLTLLFFITNIASLYHQKVEQFVLGYSCILLFAVISIYYFHQKNIFALQVPESVETPLQLTQYLNDTKQTALNNHVQEPIALKTGVIINFIDVSQKNHLSFSGRAWQIYPKNGPAPQTLNMPQALSRTVTEISRKEYNDTTMIVWWDITARIYQQLHHLKFPFGTNHVAILLSPDYSLPNSLLIPDLERYIELAKETNAFLNQKLLPGINAKAEIPGFIFKESLFSYANPITDTQKTITPLVFNLVLRQKILAPLMIYFLPIIVIIISLFVILWVNEFIGSYIEKSKWQPSLYTIGAYSGLLFSAIAIHREIRNAFSSGQLLYIEYLLIFIYVAMFTCELISTAPPYFIDIGKEKYSLLTLTRLAFWPLLLTYWLIVTLIIFYN